MRYYPPILCFSGAVHQQPDHAALTPGTAFAMSADYEHIIDLRGALDAPAAIACGGVRALEFDSLHLAVAHVYRDGWHS